MAHEIDLAAGPRGAMESVLTLLLPPAGLIVREQAALTLCAIAGQGYKRALCFQARLAATSAANGRCDGSGGGHAGVIDGALLPEAGGGGRQSQRVTLWRRFCAGVVGGSGAQVYER